MNKNFIKSKSTILIGIVWLFFAIFPHWNCNHLSLPVGRFFLFTPPYIKCSTGPFTVSLSATNTGLPRCNLDKAQFLFENFTIGLLMGLNYLVWKSKNSKRSV